MAELIDAQARQLNIGDTVMLAGGIPTDGTLVDIVHPLTDPITVTVYWREYGDQEGLVTECPCTVLNRVEEVWVSPVETQLREDGSTWVVNQDNPAEQVMVRPPQPTEGT